MLVWNKKGLLWRTNKHTGERIMVAKYYPKTGWYVFDEDLVESLNKMFVRDDELSYQVIK